MNFVNFLDLVMDKDMLIIYGLIILMAILLIVIFTIDAKSKKKKTISEEIVIEGTTPLEEYQQANNIEEKLTEKIEQLEQQKPKVEDDIKEEVMKEEPVIEEKAEVDSNIKYEEEKTEEEKEQLAKEELNQVALSLIDDNREGLTNFEIEQEENAIISYNELVKVSENLYNENEKTQYSDEGNEPITIEQLRQKFESTEPSVEDKPLEKTDLVSAIDEITKEKPENKTLEKPKVKLNDFIEKPVDDMKKFKTSPIISPVYGIEKEEHIKKDSELELEQTADLEKLDAEIRKTNQFLQILKELQKKLD